MRCCTHCTLSYTMPSVWQCDVCCSRCFLHRAYRGRCWYIYFDHLTRCLASQILLFLRFFFRSENSECVFKLSVFADVGIFFGSNVVVFVHALAVFAPPPFGNCVLSLYHCRLTAIILFSFFNFGMTTIIYRRPSLKSNLQQFRMQTMEFWRWLFLLAASLLLGRSLRIALSPFYEFTTHTAHCTHMLAYIHVRLFALLFHYLFAC